MSMFEGHEHIDSQLTELEDVAMNLRGLNGAELPAFDLIFKGAAAKYSRSASRRAAQSLAYRRSSVRVSRAGWNCLRKVGISS